MNDNENSCNKLVVMQKIENGSFCGPFQVSFETTKSISISISQCLLRTIELSSVTPVSCEEMFTDFQNLEKLLLIFDGQFYPIENISFLMDKNELKEMPDIILKKRLGYFASRDFYKDSSWNLISFQDVINTDLFDKWISLLDDLDIAFQSFLYSMSNNKMTVDLNFAFLVELAEPFAELLKEKTFYCQSLSPGEKGTTLKMCVDTLITNFGKEIFHAELSDNYSDFLNKVVGSRIRIMHIKKKQSNYFDGKRCIKYSLKFSLLFRRILFELLEIPFDYYSTNLKEAINVIDDKLFI